MRSLRLERQRQHLATLDRHFANLRIEAPSAGSFEGWFLGPKAENEELLTQLILEAIWKHCEHRRAYRPADPTYITAETKDSPEYHAAVDRLRAAADELLSQLQLSAPLASMRSQGHMLWDQVLPATVGYFGAMLYNQNNVAAEASPLTTELEIRVGNDLCRMLGFRVPRHPPPDGTIVPWGHITCDGTVANIEGLWAARNLKFYPLSLREALRRKTELARARALDVALGDGRTVRLIEQDAWTLLNLPVDETLALPRRVRALIGEPPEDPDAVVDGAVREFTVQHRGLLDFYRTFIPDAPPPLTFAPATAHYSWPKAATLLGLGASDAGLQLVDVGVEARMNPDDLEHRLKTCLDTHTPVIAVVAVVGSTEENAIDPLRRILQIRDRFRREGLAFAIHVDAAWGGYFASLLRTDAEMAGESKEPAGIDAAALAPIPTVDLSPYAREQIQALPEADAITVDPHKSGYVPYPAGGLCYRNAAMRDLVSLKSPVVFHGQAEPTVGVYGIEGSKPGAAASAVYLAHKVIRPTRGGYGKILRQSMWTSRRMYCRLATMRDERFTVACLQQLPAEREGRPGDDIEAQRTFIRENFVHRSNVELQDFLDDDPEAGALFAQLGSDGVILTFSFNLVDDTGSVNRDLDRANALNQKIFEKCSLVEPPSSLDELSRLPLILTASSFSVESYGMPFVEHFCRRLGVTPRGDTDVSFLISTTMNPWTTDASDGDFLRVIEDTLRDIVRASIDELTREPHAA
jgi:glutamate/tyrosine decarboxylase-like PLP-dependent enzyme